MQQESARYYSIDSAAGLECFEGSFHEQVFPWHFHDTYTLVMVDSGAVTYTFNDATVTVQAGEVLVVNAFEAHYNYAAAATGWTYRVCFLPVSIFNLPDACRPLFDKTVLRDAAAYEAFVQLHTRLKKEAGDAALQEAAVLLQQHFAFTLHTPLMDARFKPALEYISTHLDEKISVAALAACCCMSVSHFQRAFKKNAGLTIHAYLHMLRMEAGRRLLRQNQHIAAAAQDTGFFDQSHFHHSFKKMYGLTPRQFAAE